MAEEMTKEFKEEAWREVEHALLQYEEGHETWDRTKSVVLNYVSHLTKVEEEDIEAKAAEARADTGQKGDYYRR